GDFNEKEGLAAARTRGSTHLCSNLNHLPVAASFRNSAASSALRLAEARPLFQPAGSRHKPRPQVLLFSSFVLRFPCFESRPPLLLVHRQQNPQNNHQHRPKPRKHRPPSRLRLRKPLGQPNPKPRNRKVEML